MPNPMMNGTLIWLNFRANSGEETARLIDGLDHQKMGPIVRIK